MAKRKPKAESTEAASQASPVDETTPAVDETLDDHRTLQDHYRETVGKRASEVASRLRSARELLSELKDDFKVAKDNVDEQKELISSLESELRTSEAVEAPLREG